MGNGEYKLKRKGRGANYPRGTNSGISEDRIKELQRHINYLSIFVWMIETEVEMKTGDRLYAKQLEKLRYDIANHISKIDDTWWRTKKFQASISEPDRDG